MVHGTRIPYVAKSGYLNSRSSNLHTNFYLEITFETCFFFIYYHFSFLRLSFMLWARRMFGSHFFEINFNYKVQISRTKRFRSLRSQEGFRFLNLDLTCLNIYFDVGIFNQTLFERNFDCIPRLEDLKIRSKFYKSYGTFKFKKNSIRVPWKVSLLSPDFLRYTTIWNENGEPKKICKRRVVQRVEIYFTNLFAARHSVAFRGIELTRLGLKFHGNSNQKPGGERERERWLELPRTVFPPNLLAIIHRCNGRLLSRRKNERERTFLLL